MSSGASFSSSFLPPGTGVNIPLSPITTPTPAPTAAPTNTPAGSSFAAALGQVTSPILSGIINGQIAPENIPQLIHDIPSILSGLSPDEQDKFLQLLMTSDILNAMFTTLDNPKSRDSLNAVVRSLYDHGLMSQVAPDKAVLSEEAQGALKDALQQKLVQTLIDVSGNLPTKTASSPEGTTTAENSPQTQTAPTVTTQETSQNTKTNTPPTSNLANTTESSQTTAPTTAQTASTPASQPPTNTTVQTTLQPTEQVPTKLDIPVSQPGMPNQMPESVASLIATSVTGALQQFFSPAATTPGATANPQATLNQPAAQVAALLTSLIALGITATPEGTLQLSVPTKTDASGAQNQHSQLAQQLNQISQQFTQLGDLAVQDKWNVGTLQNFVSVPATLLALLKSIQPDDTTTTNMLKTWVDNSGIVNNALLTKANETFRDKFEFLKTIVASSFAATPAAATLAKEQQVKQQMFEQTLLQAPALLNVFKLKDMVGVFEDDIQRKQATLLFTFKRMLFNAAHEITVVAAGKPTFEYTDVGVFHEQLPFLAERIALTLPPAADELDFDLMEMISRDITFTFTYIQEHEPYRIKDILKRHPRTLLYLLCIDSPITQDYTFPRTESIGTIVDPTALNMHFMRIMNVVKKFEKNSEFLKYQPKVLEAFVDEAKYNPTSDITKTSLNIIHKAVAECSGFIDLDD